MSWIQTFNSAYPGALQFLQAGGLVQNPGMASLRAAPASPYDNDLSGCIEAAKKDCLSGPKESQAKCLAHYAWSCLKTYGPESKSPPAPPRGPRLRARNFQAGVGAIGPAIGLSPMAYGIPFPGYPSLAEQQKVGVSPQESQEWKQVYEAQMSDRMAVASNPASCPDGSRPQWINGHWWCRDSKTGGWICAEAGGECVKPKKGGLGMLGRLRAAPRRLRRRARARMRNPVRCSFDEASCPPGWEHDARAEDPKHKGDCWTEHKGEWISIPAYCEGAPAPSRPIAAPKPARMTRPAPMVLASVRARNAARVVSSRSHVAAPSGSQRGCPADCGPYAVCRDGRCVPRPTRPTKLTAGGPGGAPAQPQSRFRAHSTPSTRSRPVEQCPGGVICGWDAQGSPICAKSVSQCGTLTSGAQQGKARPGRLQRRMRARMRNPGPNGEAIPVEPYCDASACTTSSCGDCDWRTHRAGGWVRTVLEAQQQADADVARAMHDANQAVHDMYRPAGAPWADPSVAVLTKPGGPPPLNPVGTATWQQCASGPAVAAMPSSNRQPIPGGLR